MGEGRTILIADDDDEIREVLDAALRGNGYRTLVAGNGREALDHLARVTPDLILLDWMMPEVGGAAVIETIAGDPRCSVIPVVVLSAVDRPLTTALPVAVCLAKPVRMRTLLDVIDRLAGVAREPTIPTIPAATLIGRRARVDATPTRYLKRPAT